MPINPNIALGIQPVQQPNLLGQMGQIMAIRAAQQEMEGSQEARNYFAKPVSERGDPSQLLGTKQGQAAYAALNKGQIDRLEAEQKRINLVGAGAGAVLENPTMETFTSVVSNLVNRGIYTPEQRDQAFAAIGNDPSKIKAFVTPIFNQAISAEKRLSDITSRANAATAAGPGYMRENLARERFNIEQQQQAEISNMLRGGNVPTTGAAPVNALAPTAATAPAPVNALVAPVATAPLGDVYDQISGIDARIAQLISTGNPKATPIVQQLNQHRTALLASAKQQYGGALLPIETIDPATNRPTTIQGRMDQYGRAAPVEMLEPRLSVDASSTGQTTISPNIARPAPTTEVLKQRQIEEKLPTAIAQSKDTLKLIDRMVGAPGGKSKPHEGFTGAVGAGIGMRFIPGTSARDFQAMHEQVTGGAFLQAFNDLKGGGAITEKEGEKATAAITRMSLATSEKAYIEAARDFQDVVRRGIETAEKKVRPSGAAPASTGGVIDFGSLK